MAPDEKVYQETQNEARRREGRWRAPQRILGIQASPRGKRGATEQVHAALTAGLETAGAAVDNVRLADLDVRSCLGCFKCWTGGDYRCPIEDDLGPLIASIPTYDLMAWSLPLYLEGMPGLMKNLVDRMMVLNHPSIVRRGERCVHPSRFQTMPDLLVASVCGFWGRANFDPLEAHLAAVAVDHHTPLLAFLIRPDSLSLMLPEGRQAMEEVKGLLGRAGQQLVTEGTVSDDLRIGISRPLLPLDRYLELAGAWWKKG